MKCNTVSADFSYSLSLFYSLVFLFFFAFNIVRVNTANLANAFLGIILNLVFSKQLFSSSFTFVLSPLFKKRNEYYSQFITQIKAVSIRLRFLLKMNSFNR